MTSEQSAQVRALDPSAADRVVDPACRGVEGAGSWVGSRRRSPSGWGASRATKSWSDTASDIADPIGGPMRDYRAMGDEVRALVQALGRPLERAVRDRPWPPVLRAAAGGAAGWAAIRWGVTEPEPSWAAGSAAAVAAAGGLAAPAVARGAGASVVTGWAAASVLGLYLGVPETDHVVGVAAVIAVLVLTSLAAPRQASWLLVAGLDVVLVWAAVRGAPGGGPALAAALAMPGLLVVAPLTSHLPGPRRALAPVSVQPAVLVALQAGFAVVVARNAPSRDTIVEATTLTVAALVVLVLATRLAVGARSW